MIRPMRPCALIFLVLTACAATPPAAPGADASAPAVPDASSSGPDAAAGADAGAPPDAATPPDAGPVESALVSIEPPSGPASAATAVTLRGSGFSNVAAVKVGGVEAQSVVRVDERTITAVFPAVDPKESGKKDVAVQQSDGPTLFLTQGFEYFFDEDPIVFVHGYGGGSDDWDTFEARLAALGYPASHLNAIGYADNKGSNLQNLAELQPFIAGVLARTGAPKIDLVAHSMGALSSRLFIAREATPPVRDIVFLSGACHGSVLANFATDDASKELKPAFACQGEAANDIQYELNGCLTASGRTFFVDETPHGVEEGGWISYLSIRNTTDTMIVPSESSCLNQSKQKDCSDPVNVAVSWLTHSAMLTDQGVFDQAVAHLRKRNRTRP